jgi:hypothetical protein
LLANCKIGGWHVLREEPGRRVEEMQWLNAGMRKLGTTLACSPN